MLPGPRRGVHISILSCLLPLSHCKRSIKADGEGVSPPRLPLDTTDRSQNVWQWILESERQGKHKPHR